MDDHLKLAGIFTDGDLRRSLQKYGGSVLDIPIGQLMTSKVRTIKPQEMAWEAMKRMEADPQQRFTTLAVTDENEKVIGLIHLHDIIQAGL